MKIDPNTSPEQIKEILQSKSGSIRPDDSRVMIAEMQINAIKEMANDKNAIFSQLAPNEIFDVSRAYVFSENPLPSLSQRLQKSGIDFSFSLPILEKFLDENIKHRHKINRGRVQEYIDGLKAVAPKQNMLEDTPRQGNILSRWI